MEEKTIPYLTYELEQAKHERTIKRLVTALIVAIVLMFATNLAWLYMFSGYEFVDEQSDVDLVNTDGVTNYIGRDGIIGDGQDSSS